MAITSPRGIDELRKILETSKSCFYLELISLYLSKRCRVNNLHMYYGSMMY